MTADSIHWRRADSTRACFHEGGTEVDVSHAKEITCRACSRAVLEPDPSRFYEWTVKVRVNAVWVADGFNLDADRMHDIMSHDLDYAHYHEIETEIVAAPDADEVAREMGYESAVDKEKRDAKRYG